MDHREHGSKAPKTPKPRRMRKGGGSPTFCWHCYKLLQRAGNGLLFYHVVKDVDGREHRVHGDCLENVLTDTGNTWVKP